MYAVVKTGGKQYRAGVGDIIQIERLPGDVGSAVTFGEVLAIGEGSGLRIGAPFLDGATVAGEITMQARARKVIVFKFKRRKGYKRTRGHRQYFTRVRITGING
jgi:large subunit ribosomal protein L21